ncbi:transmembrane protein 214-A-like [Diadema antillarum]|uniref:transmembrane protein 214-A-like n=1 Tax=Diadema antillarum TaxID=105358 RepID=UPI003A886C4A
MSSSAAKWETVSHKKKATQADKKAAQRALAQNAPKVDQMSPLQESSTIFSAAFSSNSASKGSKSANGDAHGGKKPGQQKKKGNEGKKKMEQSGSLDEALSNVDVGELKAQLEGVKTRCPDSPALWLGDLALFLNRKLLTKETDPTFPDKPSDYPLCKLSGAVQSVLQNLIGSYQERMLKMFHQHCIREIENDLPKGQSVNGYRVFLQLLAKDYPQFVTSHLQDYLEIFKRRQSDKATSLTILWSCVQAGHSDPVIGLHVWSKVLLPLLGQKMVSYYAVAVLNRFLSSNLDEQRASQVLGPNEFFPILDYVFTPNNSLPSNLQKQLMAHYPRLKGIAFQEHRESNLRNFFPSLLARTTENCPEPLKTELLECLVFCLCRDPHCFSEWRQMYDTHMKQSSVLMKHIVSIWNTAKLPKMLLQETVRAFSVTNDELRSSHQGHKDYEDCQAVSKELLEKMSIFTFPWKSFLSVLLLAIITALALDVLSSGGFQGSRSEEFLKKSGLYVVCKHAFTKVSLFSASAFRWLQEKTPIYYGKICELCGPYLVLALDKLGDLWTWLVVVTTPLQDFISKNAPIFLEWLLKQIVIVLQFAEVWLSHLWAVVAETSVAVWTQIAPLVQHVGEITLQYTSRLWVALSPALSDGWNWLQEQFSKT